MRYTSKEKVAGKNGVAAVISILCVVLLAVMSIIAAQQNKLREQELAEIAKQQDMEEQAFLDKVNAEYDADLAVLREYLPGIVCWGDSLTAGAGGKVPYPKVLEQCIQAELCDLYDLKSQIDSPYDYILDPSAYTVTIPVINMGVGGENTLTILGRNGARPFAVKETLTIPADMEPVEIQLTAAPLRQGDAGVNPVTIGAVTGKLSISQESYTSKEYTYYFTRSAAGECVEIQPGTEVITAASTLYLDYIPVIFIGQNGGYSGSEDLISQQKEILAHQTANQDRFVIVGLHTGTAESRRALETAMQEAYGEKYINLREYMATQAMSDAGLIPTQEDLDLMAAGSAPSSLLSDSIHFNTTGYELVGKLIFKTMYELGYFNEVEEALTNHFS